MVKQPPKITILNVDDDEISCYAKSRTLRRAGFEVTEATTGSQALRYIQQDKPPLVLLDIGLPDISGLEVCRRIKSDPALALTLVLQVSASLVSSTDKARGLEGGADAYLTEPIEPEELVATVKALLRLRQAETALKTQEAFLRQVIDLNPNLIFAKDRQGRFTLANQAVAEVYGTTVEGLLGKTDADFTANPAEIKHFQRDDLEVMDSLQEKFIPEETITDAAGQVHWLQTVKRPIIGEDGLAHQILGVATDITTHKEDQAALLRLNETLEQRVSERTALIQLLQEITAAANEADTVEWALQFTLDRICAYIGWPVGHVYLLPEAGPRALIPGPIWHLDPPEQFELFRQATEANPLPPGVGLPGQVLTSDRLVWINDVTQDPNFSRMQAAAATGLKAGFGFPIWAGEEVVAVLEFFSTTTAEPDGAFLEAVTQIGTQLGRVVERKRAEKRIRESERELTEAQQIAHLGSWQWDITSNKVSWSDELYRIYGLAPQSIEITYEGFLELVHPDDRERVSGLIAAAYQNGQPSDFEHRLIRPDGIVRTLHAQGQVMRDETGQPIKMVGTGHDITERKEAEEQLHRLNAELEQRVAERTAQLEAANRELAEEIRERKTVEAALWASEKQMRLITDAAPALISYIDADLRYRFNNRAYETWFGLSRADMAGRYVWDVLGKEAYEALRPHFQAALAGQEVNYEQLAPYQSGERYIRATYTPDVDEEGRVRGMVVLVTDISERKQMEEALRESEARFRNMADTAPVMIWVTEADNSCTYLSKFWYDFTGQTPETSLGFGWLEAVHPHEREPLKEVFLAAAEKRESFQFEFRLRRQDGEYCWALVSASARLDPQGSFLGYIGSVIEIHERKRAELAQRTLAEAGQILGSSLDYRERLAQVARLAVPHLADWCAVTLIEEDGVTVHNVAVAHIDPAKLGLALEMQKRYPARPEELAKQDRPWQHGQSELYPEISDDLLEAGAQDAEHYQFLRDLQMRSAIVAPLVARERVLGFILFVWAESGNRYDQQDVALAEELARRAVIAVEIAFAYEAEQQARQSAEQAAERTAALQMITAAFSQALTPVQVAEVVIEHAVTVLGAKGGAVALLDENKTILETIDSVGYPAESVEKWQTYPVAAAAPISDAVRSETPVFIESIDVLAAQYPELMPHRPVSYPALAAIPLMLEDRVLGGMGLSFDEPQVFTPEDRAFMWAIGQQCAQALERARLYEVEQQARLEAEANQQRLALLAEMRERNRLAQELHDTVAQALGYLNIKIGMAHTLLASNHVEAAEANLLELKQVIGETYTDVREEIFNLRAKVLAGMDFMEVVDRYIDKYRRFYKLEIQVVKEADPALFEFSAEVTSQLVRTIQEALINVRKHAHVNSAIIRLGQENGEVLISIEDQGQGFDPEKTKEKTSSFGLQIMRERVESIGGSLEIHTAPGQGTRISLRYKK
ncbi:MAG: PAS domain S-box protein [Anaerolineales bacterium]|nr:PAS domain S-box protein [Anaerolineales bacterium]